MRKQVAVLIVTVLSIFGLYWINAGKTSLKKTGEVAGREEVINYTLPPGFIFSIWGLIYLGFIIYALYGLRKKVAADPVMDRTAVLVAVSMLLNLFWTIIVGADLWVWAYPLQWIMLVIAVVLLQRFALHEQPRTNVQKYLSIPFALYAGWLTVAMIPFTSDLLNRSGWNYAPFSQRTWGLILYITACIIVWAAYKRLKQPFFLLPLAWALFGFAVRFDGSLRLLAGILSGVVLLYFLVQLLSFYSRKSIPEVRGG